MIMVPDALQIGGLCVKSITRGRLETSRCKHSCLHDLGEWRSNVVATLWGNDDCAMLGSIPSRDQLFKGNP